MRAEPQSLLLFFSSPAWAFSKQIFHMEFLIENVSLFVAGAYVDKIQKLLT